MARTIMGIIAGNTVRAGAFAVLVAISGCTTRPVATGLAVAPPLPPVVATRPMPPAGASASQTIPPLGTDGRYRTINAGLSPAATIWHVRSALNVAALGCRGEQEAAIIANYNALLASKQSLLKAAFAQTEAEARKAGGADWRDAHDRGMTRIYNFFAQPPAKQRFCDVAATVAAEAAAIPAMEFTGFAAPALARLEAPFTDFYRAYDAYRMELAAWEANGPTATRLAAVAPAGSVRVPIAPPPAERTPVATIVPATVTAQPARANAPAVTPLPYAPLESIIAWTPEALPNDRRLAAADDRRKRP